MQFPSLTTNFVQDIEFAELSNVVKKKDISWLFKVNHVELWEIQCSLKIVLLDPQIILLLSLPLRKGHVMLL